MMALSTVTLMIFICVGGTLANEPSTVGYPHYQFIIYLKNYSNPLGLLPDGSACDPDSDCDPILKICTEMNYPCNPSTVLGTWNNVNTIVFNNSGEIGQWNNPTTVASDDYYRPNECYYQNLPIYSCFYPLYVHVSAYDYDEFGTDDIMGDVVIKMDLDPGAWDYDDGTYRTLTGTTKYTSFTIAVNVVCIGFSCSDLWHPSSPPTTYHPGGTTPTPLTYEVSIRLVEYSNQPDPGYLPDGSTCDNNALLGDDYCDPILKLCVDRNGGTCIPDTLGVWTNTNVINLTNVTIGDWTNPTTFIYNAYDIYTYYVKPVYVRLSAYDFDEFGANDDMGDIVIAINLDNVEYGYGYWDQNDGTYRLISGTTKYTNFTIAAKISCFGFECTYLVQTLPPPIETTVLSTDIPTETTPVMDLTSTIIPTTRHCESTEWFYWNGNCYWSSVLNNETKVDWFMANLVCKSMTSSLVDMESFDEEAKSLLLNQCQNTWLNIVEVDPSSTNGSIAWIWFNYVTNEYRNWNGLGSSGNMYFNNQFRLSATDGSNATEWSSHSCSSFENYMCKKNAVAGTGLDSLQCRVGGLVINGSCFWVTSSQVDYFEAINECNNQGGQLASIHSTSETMHTYVAACNASCGSDCDDVWIGLDVTRPSVMGSYNAWSWFDGSDVDYENWQGNTAPYRYNQDACAVMGNSGQWVPEKCIAEHRAICRSGST